MRKKRIPIVKRTVITKTNTNIVKRDELGRLEKGSVLNSMGRPPGIMNYGGENNRQIRAFLLSKFYEKMYENWEMIYDNIIKACKEEDLRALFGLLPYMIPTQKEKDVDIIHVEAAVSKAEIMQEIREKFMEFRKFVEEKAKENSKNEEK